MNAFTCLVHSDDNGAFTPVREHLSSTFTAFPCVFAAFQCISTARWSQQTSFAFTGTPEAREIIEAVGCELILSCLCGELHVF